MFCASQVVLVVKNPAANAGDKRDVGSVSGLRRFPWRRAWQPTPVLLPGESHGQRGDWQAIVYGVTKSWTRLKRLSTNPRMFMFQGHAIFKLCALKCILILDRLAPHTYFLL